MYLDFLFFFLALRCVAASGYRFAVRGSRLVRVPCLFLGRVLVFGPIALPVVFRFCMFSRGPSSEAKRKKKKSKVSKKIIGAGRPDGNVPRDFYM